MRASRVLAAACMVGFCALGAPARAQNVAAAKKMFDQGLADMQAGHFDKGCPALEASYKLDPRPGTLFTLAECEAKWGRLATAVARYDDYLSTYARLTEDQQRKQANRPDIARDQKAALSPQVSQVTLVLTSDAPKETAVRCDGTELPAAMLGIALPMDPGEHLVTTQVPGGEPTDLRVTIGRGEKKQITLQVKALRPAAASKPADVHDASVAPTLPVVSPPSSKNMPLIVVGAALGALMIGTGAGLGLAAQGKGTDADALLEKIHASGVPCTSPPQAGTCQDLLALRQQHDRFYKAFVGLVVSGAVIGAATMGYALWPAAKQDAAKPERSTSVHLLPVVGPGAGGAVVSGAF